MSRFLKSFAVALFALLMFVPAASAQRRGGFGVRGFGGGFRGGWDVGYFGPGWGWYNPYWYGYGWGYPYAYGPVANSGKVKIEGAAKDTSVFVDGGYAGTVGELKKFALRPGDHDIELRDHSGHIVDKERIQVIAGKTLEIHATSGSR